MPVLAVLALCGFLLASGPAGAGEASPPEEELAGRRAAMVAEQLAGRGLKDPRVLAAMAKVPRERFLPAELRGLAYLDAPLPIGLGQTISQPFMVAYLAELLELTGEEKVLEVGTGSGYQAAVLAELAGEVYSIELLGTLSERAGAALAALGYRNIRLRVGDGYRGWPEAAPFDAICVTAAPPEVPPELVKQLKVGGRMVLPVGEPGRVQTLVRLRKTAPDQVTVQALELVRFVPMVPGRE